MSRQLPPLNALKACEAAARSESFTRAAEELCVTQGAVSHQVKSLENTLGIKLFNRVVLPRKEGPARGGKWHVSSVANVLSRTQG